MAPSYRCWNIDKPDDMRIMHLWLSMATNALKEEAVKQFPDLLPTGKGFGSIRVMRVGRKPKEFSA